jgi:dipeptidyl aminopeptidase/acylaminoacyl peptidase
VSDSFLDVFNNLPRVAGLALSPDGTRLVAGVATVAPDGKRFLTSLYAIDVEGRRAPRRLTRGGKGEANPVFLPDGSLLFTAARVDPEVKDSDDDVPALWLLPADGGEAREVHRRPLGVESVQVARDSGAVVLAAGSFPGSSGPDDDDERKKARKDADVSAVLFDSYPIRFWDRHLGPVERRLAIAPAPTDARLTDPVDLTPQPGRALDEQGFAVTPDGSTVVTGWVVGLGRGERRSQLVAIDAATGSQRVLADQEDVSYAAPVISPDGRWVACVRMVEPTYDTPPVQSLHVIELATGEGRDVAADSELWPHALAWSPDSTTVYLTADEQGHAPVFAVDTETGRVRRLTASGAHSDPVVSPDGRHVFAVRSSYTQPPVVVRVDTSLEDQEAVELPSPGAGVVLPGRVEEVRTTAADGSPLRGWLVLPQEASAGSPAPLALWVHGGPMGSWNAWSWRWCPHLLAERGYAVLLPDPALSTGYGQRMLERGWDGWGNAPYDDVMRMTDAALERSDLDGSRTAAMGGSFGGYMANWIATKTDRFKAIVTHASLYALDQFRGTTDDVTFWERVFGDLTTQPQRYTDNSPHLYAENIRTPMLVIHGDRDYRVPIGEALRLWTDLVRSEVPAKFLFFPDENHWVLKPANARLWYDTVLGFLDEHVLGKDFERPALV